ncbi:MAG: hypothetical protein WC783_00705 [Candidatus Paceibacterota bacterium]|jgi:hypothetical protein
MAGERNIKIYDTASGTYKGLSWVGSQPRVCNQTYLQAIAESEISGHTAWSKIGFSPSVTTTDSDIWSYAGTQAQIAFPAAAMQMEVVSSDADDDSVALVTATSDSGTSTTLVDADGNFVVAGIVAGDVVILDDASGNYGFVTGVAATTLTLAGGWSSGYTSGAVAYRVIDNSADTGAQVVKIEYLDSNYATRYQFVALDGATPVATSATVADYILRVNSFRVIAAGTSLKAEGNIQLRHIDNTPVYSYITAGFTRARNIAYTVPAGKTLFVTTFSGGVGNIGDYSRLYTRATQWNGFKTDGIWYPYTEMDMTNNTVFSPLECPTKIVQKVDIKISGITSTGTGAACVSLRGWLE